MKKIPMLQRLQRAATSPWTIFACIALGFGLGTIDPGLAKNLDMVGIIYVDLLKMIILPFMFSAVIFSLQKLFRDGEVGKILGRTAVVILTMSMVAALVAGIGHQIMRPGVDMLPEARAALGNIVGASVENSHLEMSLHGEVEKPKPSAIHAVVASLVPSNIFAALASGETLKALVFALLFGVAVGQVPGKISDGLAQTLETIYCACQLLTRWISLPVPVVLVCMIAAQVADSGVGPIKTMLGFVGAYLVVCAVLLGLAVLVLARRANTSFAIALDTMREPFALGVGTNNSASCMPVMIDGLAGRLAFKRAQVELLVPLSVLLFRAGAIAYFVCATLFTAAIYERALSGSDLIVVMLFSVLSGFASTGMAGILTITMIGNACSYLGLPFEAAFILFVAVDPICAMGRTAVTVIGSCAAVSMVCVKPLRP